MQRSVISGLVALAANIVTIFTAVGGFSGSLSFESPKLSEPMAFLMLLVLIYSWMAISWAIIARYARIKNVKRLARFILVLFLVISGVGFLLLPVSIPTVGIFGDVVNNEPVWEDTAIAYIPMCYFLNAIVIGLLMPFVYSEMLDDFPPH